jgi:hypothetical protein
MEIRRRTWIAALKLAVVVSLLSAIVAVAASALVDAPAVAIVLPVIAVAFTLSWVQTGRLLRSPEPVRADLLPGRRHAAPIG